jgi:hypothetical protein
MKKSSLLELDLQIEYKIKSELGMLYETRYTQQIDADIYTSNMIEKRQLVGKMSGIKLLFHALSSTDFEPFDIFDGRDECRDFTCIYDFKKNCFKSKNFKDTYNIDLLILSKIEILPEFRGLNISKFAIKDFILNFSSGCGLIGLIAFPLQFGAIGADKEHCNKMEYEKIETTVSDGRAKLIAHYRKIGFKVETGGLMTLSIDYLNKRLDKIDLDNLT